LETPWHQPKPWHGVSLLTVPMRMM
jgi:hypothetical protein